MKLTLITAFAALCFAAPANATSFLNVGIDGTLFGTTQVTLCNSASPVECLFENGGAYRADTFRSDFGRQLGMMVLIEGANAFSFGHPRATGLYTGTILNDHGYLTGSNLWFSFEDSNSRFGGIGARSTFASASSFNVSGGVPEPSTWAMMLLGFGAIGTTLRRKRRVTVPQVS